MDKNEISEEVSTTPIIKDIERLFVRGFKSLRWLVVSIFTWIWQFLNFAMKYAVILFIAGILGGVLGFFSTELFPRKYASSMILKLNVDAKSQLENDISYFNALISKQENTILSQLFDITPEEAGSLVKFEFFAASDYIEKIYGLNEIYKSIDTSLVKVIDIEQLASMNDPIFSNRFKITIQATNEHIFSKLEKPLMAYLERSEELKLLLAAGQKSLNFQRQVYLKEMQAIDTLSNYMNKALLANSENASQGDNETFVMLGGEASKNRPVNAIDLQDKYILYAQKIAKIDLSIQEYKSIYFVNSHLNPYGEKIGYGAYKRALMGAFLLFCTTCFVIYLVRTRKKLN